MTDTFSTVEVTTNMIWIDGRKIYRKVLKGKTKDPGMQMLQSVVDGEIIIVRRINRE